MPLPLVGLAASVGRLGLTANRTTAQTRQLNKNMGALGKGVSSNTLQILGLSSVLNALSVNAGEATSSGRAVSSQMYLMRNSMFRVQDAISSVMIPVFERMAPLVEDVADKMVVALGRVRDVIDVAESGGYLQQQAQRNPDNALLGFLGTPRSGPSDTPLGRHLFPDDNPTARIGQLESVLENAIAKGFRQSAVGKSVQPIVNIYSYSTDELIPIIQQTLDQGLVGLDR